MNQFKNAAKFFVMLSFGVFTAEAENKTDLFETTKQQYLRSFPIVHEEKSQEKKDENQKITLQVRELSEREQREIVFDLVSKIPANDAEATFIDQTLLKNLEIFCGGEDATQNLFNTIKRTKTVAGEAGLAKIISSPIFDTNLLKNRQVIVQELLTNPALFEEFEAIFDEIKKAEPIFLSYWEKEISTNEELISKVYLWDLFKRFNKNPAAMELFTRLQNLMLTLGLGYFVIDFGISLGITEYLYARSKSQPISLTKAFCNGLKDGLRGMSPWIERYREKSFPELVKSGERYSPISLQDWYHFSDHTAAGFGLKPVEMKGIVTANFVFLIFNSVYKNYQLFLDAKLKADIAKHLQSKLIATASFVRQIKKLYFLMQDNPALQSLAIHEFNFSGSKDFNNLLHILDHNTFKGSPSIFSLTGRVLAAHKIMKDVKDEFAPFIEFAGRVEALLSITKLYQEHETKLARYSFATFVEQANTPYVLAQNFWNPFINPEIVVCNSIVLGDQKPNNIILTGPNTGGKSTVIKGLQLSLLMAQTLGIVPADQLIFTPFAVINCSLNVADDTSGGVSLFKAEVLRAKTIIERIRGLVAHQFAYTIMDEVFSGTSPKEGEQAALRYAKELALCKNSMCTIATHFPLMPDLEKEGAYKNYKVSVYKNEHGKIVRPFKLEEGKSELNIAMDLLEEEGIFSSVAA